MQITIDTLRDIVTLVGFISIIVGGVMYIKALGVNNKARARENRVIIKALFAIVDALRKQGCNGPITEAYGELHELLFDKVSDDRQGG